VSFVWEHPESGSFPTRNQGELLHARNFSEVIHGAALLYNLMLAEKAGLEELTGEYRAALEEWVSSLESRASALRIWSRDEFWKLVCGMNPRVPIPTRAFVDAWLDLALSSDPSRIRVLPRARRLIEDRERSIKGRLARLQNSEALLRWRGASGAGQLDYRWNPQVRRIVADIQRGLGTNA